MEFPIVAIGASAGGLDACRKLLDALPPTNGMAFIIVQHLDPSHDSMLVDLLAGHTSMPVLLATDGMAIERERVYVIPPGVYLSADDKGALRLSKPQARHGARLPFDFLLNSLAREYGARAVCVVLSGTGADGSLGLKAVKDKGGLVIAQDFSEADYDGMPRSAVATGAVDLVLRAAKIAEALVARERGRVFVPEPPKSRAQKSLEDLLPDMVALLRTKTVHDFSLYKHGTLERRVERRMALAGVKTAANYLDLLLRDANERDQLSRDLLINVTGFFRDAAVFDFLAKSVIPDLVRDHPLDRPLRIWVAGCSSGEETYSLRRHPRHRPNDRVLREPGNRTSRYLRLRQSRRQRGRGVCPADRRHRLLPPGLFEMVIAPRPANVPAAGFVTGDWIARFEARSLDDVRALGRNSPEDDRAFAAVARLSELNLSFYRTFLQPFVRALVNQPMADLALALNPLRLSYTIFGDRNPWMKGLQPLAAAVAAARRPVAADNPFLALQKQVSDQITTTLDSYRVARDKLEEQMFFGFYGSPFVQALLGISKDSVVRPVPGTSPEKLAARQVQMAAYAAMLETGGSTKR